jgi:hypothetical protein
VSITTLFLPAITIAIRMQYMYLVVIAGRPASVRLSAERMSYEQTEFCEAVLVIQSNFSVSVKMNGMIHG